MIEFTYMRAAGYLPQFLSAEDQLDAVSQINTAYAHGGGWQDFEGFTLGKDWKTPGRATLLYKGDPPTKEISRGVLRDETIVLFQHSWVAVIQADGSMRVARLD